MTDSKSKNKLTKEEAEAIGEPREPVEGFPMKFRWHTGPWEKIFDKQIALIGSDIRRAKAEDRIIVYLSCPISSRGGGHSGTNVDVAKHIERALLSRWGEAFWILNPAQYQLESKAGTGLMDNHAKELNIDIKELLSLSRPLGGDYMRMWTTVLVENDLTVGQRILANELLKNTGQYFDAFYFIGPRDVHSFVTENNQTLTAGIQSYFARKYATDPDFRNSYSIRNLNWGTTKEPIGSEEQKSRDEWENRRMNFLRYYGVRASANYSLGAHDEWLIYKHINDSRRNASKDPSKYMVDGDPGEQLAGFFDGGQIDPASTETSLSKGYAT